MPVLRPQIVDTERARLPQRNPPRKVVAQGPSFTLSKGFSPVILTSGEITLGSNGAIAVPDHKQLQPIERSAMLIDSIHYNIRASGLSDPRWSVRTKLTMGRHNITNEFVPLAGLEYSYLTDTLQGSIGESSTDFAGNTFTGSRWKLPVPLYVPAGSLLYCQLQVSPFFTLSTVVADVSYIGRLLPVDYPVPRTVKVPYVTSLFADTSGQQLESKDLQLGNPFEVPFYAQRMIMRNFEVNSELTPAIIEAYSTVPTVTLRGTFNDIDISVANLIPHYRVFDDGQTYGVDPTLGHHALNLFNLEMQPKDRFDLQINWGATPSNTPVAVAALIGWRNEKI